MAAGALAIERGVATGQIAAAGGLALPAAAFNGMPDPVLRLAARAMGVVTGLATLEPRPARPRRRRAPGTPPCGPPPACSSSLAFWHDCTTVITPAERAAATAGLTSAAAGLGKAAEALHGLIELARIAAGRSGRTGRADLS